MKKIDIQSYMIGDWLWCGSNYGQVAEIFTLKDELVIMVNNRRNKYFEEINPYEVTTSAEDIRPIPLTEDFFEKNRFVEDNSFFPLYKKFDSEDNRIIITDETNSGDGYWYVHVDNEDFDTIGSCDVKYVHQFQQMLRLCRYEINVVV